MNIPKAAHADAGTGNLCVCPFHHFPSNMLALYPSSSASLLFHFNPAEAWHKI